MCVFATAEALSNSDKHRPRRAYALLGLVLFYIALERDAFRQPDSRIHDVDLT